MTSGCPKSCQVAAYSSGDIAVLAIQSALAAVLDKRPVASSAALCQSVVRVGVARSYRRVVVGRVLVNVITSIMGLVALFGAEHCTDSYRLLMPSAVGGHTEPA